MPVSSIAINYTGITGSPVIIWEKQRLSHHQQEGKKKAEAGIYFSVLHTILSQMKTPFAVIKNDGVIILASSAFAGIFSFRDSVIEGVHICDFFLRGDRERFLDELRDPDSGPLRTASLSLTGVSRDGRHLALSVWLSPVEGNPDLFLAFFEDKSDSQKDQNKIEKLEHQAAIGTFTSGVAHEFNNVLAGIRGYAQLAKNDLSDRTLVTKAFRIIEQESIRGADLCKNLSLYTGNKKLSLEPIVISDLVATTIELQKRYLIENSVAVETEMSEMPPFLADRFKLQQVILNLLINARHATLPKGSGTIIIRAKKEDNTFVLSMTDDGTGIEPFNLPRIFDPFYSNKNNEKINSESATVHGTGLGLPVCQTIVKQHGGTIDVVSQPGAGSTFTIRIPFHLAERRSKQPTSEIVVRRKNAEAPSILVVDDEMSVREVLYRAMVDISQDVVLASSAEECESLVRSRSFGIIILDYILPEMSADRLLPVIRETNPSAKVLIISGWNGSPVKKEAIRQQVNGWIEKPFNVETIIKAIEELSYDRSSSPKT